ncbi:unnamed protein product [Vitrella brassicaformis CCMP3155]|uniref:EF-hand domain-containing protein n=1 Tax=Vitrella brassicaformis (strain CCMP3155) TaxID=1169540 RepID=A0A0G4G3X4_VITBC|nr:unnamed protein product [Vitrella brassicaformis CCMP3155]|eukprot:CEM23132.1 unnamed protein product [Vitrella brassicaformis CCMP3155]
MTKSTSSLFDGVAVAASGRTEVFRVAAKASARDSAAAERIVQILRELDTDQDGKFNTEEVVVAVKMLLHERSVTRQLKWVIAAMAAFYAATLAIILGLVVGGSELTKEATVGEGGVFRSKRDSNVKIRTQEDLDLYELSDLFSTPLEQYDRLEAILVPHGNDTFGHYRVASILNTHDSLAFTFMRGEVLSVRADGYTFTDARDRTLRDVTFKQEEDEAASRRRLMPSFMSGGGRSRGYSPHLAIRYLTCPLCLSASAQRVFSGVTHSFVIGGRRVDVPFNSPVIRSYVGGSSS